MSSVCWLENPGEHESLALCLRAVLAGADVSCAYDELVAALGLGTAVVASRCSRPSEWAALGRDLALCAAADAYGLQLRPLHPPAASRGLSASAEFSIHFRDSYVPLIERALASGQTCLAWRGWADPNELAWGVVDAIEQGELVGFAPVVGGRRVRLLGPAHQAYLVERLYEQLGGGPTARERYALARRQALAFWNNRAAEQRGLLVGSAAYHCWIEMIAHVDPHSNAHRSFARLTRMLISARRHQAAWLRRTAAGLGGGESAALRWAEACERVADRLGNCCEEDVVRELIASPAGQVHYRGLLEECRAVDTVLMADLAREA